MKQGFLSAKKRGSKVQEAIPPTVTTAGSNSQEASGEQDANKDAAVTPSSSSTPSPSRPSDTSRRQSAQSSDSGASEASNNTRESPVSLGERDSDLESVEATSQESPVKKDSVEVAKENKSEAVAIPDSSRSPQSDQNSQNLQKSDVTQREEGDLKNSSEVTKDLENTNQYLAQMMYNRQKKTLLSQQETNNNVKPRTPSLDGTAVSPNRKSSPKSHNPFQIRMNSNRAQTGVRLGLYSADNLPVIEVGKKKCSREGVKEIGRAQINACLHRQYMAEVKQQARAYKNQ